MLLLHGNGGSGRDWNTVIPALAARHRVISTDLPGYGNSDALPDSSLESLGRFVWSFATALGIDRPILMGHSFGGLIAVHAALAAQRRVAKLILVSSAGLGREVRLMQIIAATTPLGRLVVAASLLPGGSFVRTVELAIATARQPWRIPPSWWTYQLRLGKSRRTLDMTRAAFERCIGPFGQVCLVNERLKELNVPTLVIWGLLDTLVPWWHAPAAARRLPRGQWRLLPFSGHLPHVDTAEEFLRVIAPFLDEEPTADELADAKPVGAASGAV
ncbi:alpha/beta fold hydrolase [Allorhizocola rhizosphaerae]|uniref:alpha/beta fold hydrolase n=1 Tax=Allorhizocola rhizosphaerae TaxID=1872709 RepID=UPI0013C37229|nr:alpha/beta fold hydrolase [Allorhizocola rhizosphaerae]